MKASKKAQTDSEREPGGLPLKLWRALSRAHAALFAAATEEAARHGLTVGELDVLDALRGGPLSVGELQRRVRVSSGGATYLVSRLEERGLVERRAAPADRRTRYAGLTAAGTETATAAHAALTERMRRAGAGVGKKDRRTLVGLLDLLTRSCAMEPAAQPPAEPPATETAQH